MTVYFSAATNGFYDSSIHLGAIPADAVEITDAEHKALLAGQATGKRIVADAEGCPILVEPVVSPGQEDARRRAEILAELTALDAASTRPLRAIAVGTASAADQARLVELDAQAATLRRELAALG